MQEKTDVVFVTEKCCNIDQLASCDLLKRGGDFLLLRRGEETGVVGVMRQSTAAARCE